MKSPFDAKNHTEEEVFQYERPMVNEERQPSQHPDKKEKGLDILLKCMKRLMDPNSLSDREINALINYKEGKLAGQTG
jgi:hypothetical protein